jgi:hypothetical protein
MERKLEILIEADFSEWRKWGRYKKEGRDPSEAHGFGGMLVSMGKAASNITSDISSAGMLNLMLYNYDILAADYATIPFDEMDQKDPDFAFLFRYKEKLDELGQKLKLFETRTRDNGMRASANWPEYQEFDRVMGELLKRNYRSEVLDTYGITFSDPSPE